MLLMRFIFVGAAVCFSALLSGCASPKSFLDPNQPKLTYESISRPTSPLKLKLVTEFQRDGEKFPRADPTLRDSVERVLRASGVIIPTEDSADGQVNIIVNNIGKKGAAAKGFGTGLTLGLVGTTVMDAYELRMKVNVRGKVYSSSVIKHALFTTIGNTSAPSGVETMPISVAFQKSIEQMLLRALKEAQESSSLDASVDNRFRQIVRRLVA